jgi:hypothetical protein
MYCVKKKAGLREQAYLYVHDKAEHPFTAESYSSNCSVKINTCMHAIDLQWYALPQIFSIFTHLQDISGLSISIILKNLHNS